MTVTLRPIALPDDLDFLYQVYASTRAAEMALVGWTDAQKEAFVRFQFNAQHQYYQENYGDARFDVILQVEQPVGRLYVQRPPDQLHIIDITVLPEYQHRGIGTALLQTLIAESEQTKRPIQIHVEQFNPALHWYQQLGFEQIELYGVYFRMERQPDHVGTR
ncbi:MAG: GNAT family N-acetyltransferase [Aggregatilineales bacterium]